MIKRRLYFLKKNVLFAKLVVLSSKNEVIILILYIIEPRGKSEQPKGALVFNNKSIRNLPTVTVVYACPLCHRYYEIRNDYKKYDRI